MHYPSIHPSIYLYQAAWPISKQIQLKESTLCVVGFDAGKAVTLSTGPPTSDGVFYILHMSDETIPTVRNN